MVDFDVILEKVGGCGRYQMLMYVLIGFAGIHPGAHNLAQVFTAAVPEHWCFVPGAPPGIPKENLRRLSSPPGEEGLDSCRIYVRNYSAITDWSLNASAVPNNTETVFCTEMQYDHSTFESTVVTRWNLVCGDTWRQAAAQSIYMAGFLTGCIFFGSLSDRFGRKPIFLISIIILVLTGTVAAFAPEYWSFVIFRYVSGTAVAGSFTGGFVMTMEMIDERRRLWPGLFYQGWFALGYMLLSGIAYYVRNYRDIQLIISVPPIIFLSYYWFLDESPRWLVSLGKIEEAEKIVRRMARMNRRPFPEDLFKELTLSPEIKEKTEDKHYSFLDLMRTPNLRKRAFNTFYNWFVNSMVFYGLSFGVSDLAGSVFLTLTISALMEFPSYVISILLLQRIGRRFALAALMVAGGIFCFCIVFISIPEVQVTMSMLGKLAISGSFATIYVFSAEIFPTVVRNTAVGSGSMFARAGGICAPQIALLGKVVWGKLPNIIFAASTVAAGLLAILLPETLNQHLPETLEDGEKFGTKGYHEHIQEKKQNGVRERMLNMEEKV